MLGGTLPRKSCETDDWSLAAVRDRPDRLARLDSHQSPATSETAEGALNANPRPLQKKLEHETGFEPATLTLARGKRRPKS
jgi:hypothetical protein